MKIIIIVVIALCIGCASVKPISITDMMGFSQAKVLEIMGEPEEVIIRHDVVELYYADVIFFLENNAVSGWLRNNHK